MSYCPLARHPKTLTGIVQFLLSTLKQLSPSSDELLISILYFLVFTFTSVLLIVGAMWTIESYNIFKGRNPKKLAKDIATTQQDVEIIKKDVDILKKDVEIIKEDVDILKKDVKTIKNDVKIIKKFLTDERKSTYGKNWHTSRNVGRNRYT